MITPVNSMLVLTNGEYTEILIRSAGKPTHRPWSVIKSGEGHEHSSGTTDAAISHVLTAESAAAFFSLAIA